MLDPYQNLLKFHKVIKIIRNLMQFKLPSPLHVATLSLVLAEEQDLDTVMEIYMLIRQFKNLLSLSINNTSIA